MAKGELTGKQRAFIDAWFECNYNGVEAARRAGYHGTYWTLAATASENLKKPKIREEIDRRWKLHGMGAAEVMAGWAEMARGTIENFLRFEDVPRGQGGETITIAHLDLAQARDAGKLRLAKSITWTKEGVKLELYSAKDAYDSIARSLGMFKDTNLNIDLASLSDDQVERIAKGEDPLVVLASASRIRETAARSEESE